MHEFSVANQIAERTLEVAKEKKAKRIKSIELAVGELSLLAEEQLKFWLKEILGKKKIVRDIQIKISSTKAKIKCQKCGYKGVLKPNNQNHFYPIFFCPSCEDSNIEIIEGRDCVIKKVKVQM
jgi:hydrogenase nickel insertion protein HypA